MTPSDARRGRRPCDGVEAATLAASGLPRCPDHLPDVLCLLPRRIETGACIGCFPARAAFPVSLAGRHPRLHFRGLLRLHSRYGPSGCSAAQGGLCHEASARLLHPTARQLPELPITLWVDPSSTGHPRLSRRTAKPGSGRSLHHRPWVSLAAVMVKQRCAGPAQPGLRLGVTRTRGRR